MVDRSKQYNESGVEIARLRSEVCNLKAVLHDLTNKEEVAASLAAERSLNRCVTYFDESPCMAPVAQPVNFMADAGSWHR